ncbi:MAG: hypothetical protein KDH20_10990, partial [Rhodocyclaceae bacterium]|nr:hypothetical protein [Rhodocyclaceae bacterium]
EQAVVAIKARGAAERAAAAEVVAAVRMEQQALIQRAEAEQATAAAALQAAKVRKAAALEAGVMGPQRAAVLRDEVAAQQALAAATTQSANVRAAAARAVGAAEANAAEVARAANGLLADAVDARTAAGHAAGNVRAQADREVATSAAARAAANDRLTASEARLAAATRVTTQAMALARKTGAWMLGLLGGWPGVIATSVTALGLWALANDDAAASVRDHTAEIDDQLTKLDDLNAARLGGLAAQLEQDIIDRQARIEELRRQSFEAATSRASGLFGARDQAKIAQRDRERAIAIADLDRATAGLVDRQNQLADVRARLAGQNDADTGAPPTPTGPDAKTLSAAGEYLAKLREQTAEAGLNRDELIRLQAARVADTVAGTEQAAAIRAAAEALIQQTAAAAALRAEKERGDAELAAMTQAEMDAEKAGIDARKERAESHQKAIDAIRQEQLHFASAADRMRAEARQWRDEQMGNLDMTKAGYEDFALQIEDIYTRRLAEAQDQALRDSTDWRDGAKRALRDYEEVATDVAAGVEDAMSNGLRGMEDALTQFVTTGKLSFSDLANSILADLARIAIRQSITGPLASALGGLFGGGASSVAGGFGAALSTGTASVASMGVMQGTIGASVRHAGSGPHEPGQAMRILPAATFAHVARYHTGIGPREEAAVIRRDESVLTPGQMQVLAPLAAVSEAVRGAMPSPGGTPVTVNVLPPPGHTGRVERSRGPDGGELLTVIVEQVRGAMIDDVQTGRGLGGAMQDRYGLHPVNGF